MKYKVVMTDHVYPDLHLETQRLEEAGAELVFLDAKDPTRIAKAVVDADAVITCYAPITAEAIRGMRRCRSISKTGIGVNNIDVGQASKQGIRVLNVPDYCIEEVSDATVALTLSLTRRIPFLWDNVRAGKWSLAGSEGISRMSGKTVGFLGFGRIARRAAEKLRAFGVELMAYDPYIDEKSARDTGARLADLDSVIRQADILSLNMPLTDETEGMIDREALQKMKKTAILINTARGPLVNENDLCEAIRTGEIAGAGLDVVCEESSGLDSRLFSMPNVVITPHAAFYSIESTQELREKILADVITVLGGGTPKYQVNR